MSFCVPVWHQKGVKSSTAVKVFSFSFLLASEGGQTKERGS